MPTQGNPEQRNNRRGKELAELTSIDRTGNTDGTGKVNRQSKQIENVIFGRNESEAKTKIFPEGKSPRYCGIGTK